LSKNELASKPFQYSGTDMTSRNQWFGVDLFKSIFNWTVNGQVPVIQWDQKLPSDLIYKIVSACCPQQSIFVGIRGGLKELEQMNAAEISQKSWSIISADAPPTSQWIPGDIYKQVLIKKGLP
jgi:hypothetical protein